MSSPGTIAPGIAAPAALDASHFCADAEYRLDPIKILLLCAQNGYVGDIIAAASLTADPDLWSYFKRVRLGRSKVMTWLTVAAAMGHDTRVTWLLDSGAPLEERDSVGAQSIYQRNGDAYYKMTPLGWAVSYGRASTVRLLVERGADTLVTDSRGRSPMHVVVLKPKNVAIMEALMPDAARTLAALDAVDNYGATPLVYLLTKLAPGPELVNTVRFLLEKGADVRPKIVGGKLGRSPLIEALAWEHPSVEALRLLLQYGADCDSRNSDDEPALHTALSRNQGEVVDALLAAGADPNLRGKYGRTAMHMVPYHGLTAATAELLWAHGGLVIVEDTTGDTPTAIARAMGLSKLVDALDILALRSRPAPRSKGGAAHAPAGRDGGSGGGGGGEG